MINNVLKSVLKTALYFLDQSDRVASDMRDRVSDSLDSAADRVSDLRDRAYDRYEGESHTLRTKVLTFAAGVGVGIGAGMLFCSAASGEEIRGSIGDKVHDISEQVRRPLLVRKGRDVTGTEG